MNTKSAMKVETRPLRLGRRVAAFTLIEIMVVMVLLSVIILGLMAMFNQTQRAFQAGMAQTDQLEGGRMFTDLLLRDLEQVTPSGQTNGVNFYVQIPPLYTPLQQVLPGSTLPRTNIIDDLFFLSRFNQTWSGIGYFVRTNDDLGVPGTPGLVGSLYRFQTNVAVAQFDGTGMLPYLTFRNATNRFTSISKVLDGVVEFRVRCYDTNGTLLVGNNNSFYLPGDNLTNSYAVISNSVVIAPGEVESYAFSNHIVPAYVEVQLGILEPAVLKRYNSIPSLVTRSNFLANHAGNVQLFRQRIAIRNVDPSAYLP